MSEDIAVLLDQYLRGLITWEELLDALALYNITDTENIEDLLRRRATRPPSSA